MACFSGVVRSSVLSMDTGLHVILPYDRPASKQSKPCKILYLLHGLGENSAAWTRYTMVETYARHYGLAVVMPEVQRSFYMDMAHGLDYFTYVTQELPALCRELFNISTAREDSFIAGLSMGGYGAIKCGLTFPDRYRGCASFSGALDIAGMSMEQLHADFIEELHGILGMDLRIKPQDNLFHLAERIADLPTDRRPEIFFTCGLSDALYAFNRNFKQKLEMLALPHEYREWPGDHTWDFWNESLSQLLQSWNQLGLL